MHDRLMNFVFHKFVFVFGVLNTQYFDEVVMWAVWFIGVAFIFTLTTVAHNRYKYVSDLIRVSIRLHRCAPSHPM